MRKWIFAFLLIPLLLFASCRSTEKESEELPLPLDYPHLVYGLPSVEDTILPRRGFALGYSNKYRQALWVCYVLRDEDILKPKVKRRNRFRADPAIRFRPVQPRDYTRTGYDRGHLAPAADMLYSVETMTHSFYMTNISPQIPGCNRGIWKRLETAVRKWALQEKTLYIITGPIFKDDAKQMGKTDIPVPYAFYKVIFDLTPPYKMIGFVIPNEPSWRRLHSFAVSVEAVEELTGNDFFFVLDDGLENQLEASVEPALWGF